MRQDFDKVVEALAPIALQLLTLSRSDHTPTGLEAESLLKHLLRELEDECPRNVSVQAAAEAERRGYGDLRQYHYDDRNRIGRKKYFLWEHFEQVRDMLATLRSLQTPTVEEVAAILRRARIAWILRREDEHLPKGPRPDPKKTYETAGITLVHDWERSWPVREPTAKRADGAGPPVPARPLAESDPRESLVSAFALLEANCDRKTSGFVNIKGPAGATTAKGAALVIVERNGAVSLRNESLAAVLEAPLRPGAKRPPQPNDRNYGEARWSISPEELRLRFDDAAQVARAVAAAFERAGLVW